MDRSTFELHLTSAAEKAVQFARRYVVQTLPADISFVVYPNQSYDGNPRAGDEAVFPEESLPGGQCHGPWTVQETLDFLWRDAKVPEWIDISVEREDGLCTQVALLCCGRFTAQEEQLYHRYAKGLPPFSIKSPPLPPGWKSVKQSGKFDLYWQKNIAETVARYRGD